MPICYRPPGLAINPTTRKVNNQLNSAGSDAEHEFMFDSDPPCEHDLLQNTLWPESRKLYGHGFELYSLCANKSGSLIASACKVSRYSGHDKKISLNGKQFSSESTVATRIPHWLLWFLIFSLLRRQNFIFELSRILFIYCIAGESTSTCSDHCVGHQHLVTHSPSHSSFPDCHCTRILTQPTLAALRVTWPAVVSVWTW